MDSHEHTCTRRSHPHILRESKRERESGEERELNTPSGSLVERATGLAPRWLICESLLLKQLCASVHTLCRRGGSAFTHLHINKPPETFIKSWENRRYLHVKLQRTSASLAGATRRGPPRPLANPPLHTGAMIMTSSVQLLLLPIAPAVMERNTPLTLLALSTRAANVKSSGLH